MNESPISYLHINAQFTHHDTARICGTRLGLEALARAVAHALTYHEAESDPVFVNDGEGYTVHVERLDDDKEIDAAESPYVCYYVSDEITHWRERAFKAEAELHRMRRSPPSTPKQGEGE